jgi:penicillin-binding protein 2
MSRVVSESDVLTKYFSDVDARVGGKTGTAQVTANSTLPDNALFSGFAPYDDPQIVGSCILEAGEVGANASKVVASVFEEFFAEDEPTEEAKTEDSGSAG